MKVNNNGLIESNISEKKRTGKLKSSLKVNYLSPKESGNSKKARNLMLLATAVAAVGVALLAAAGVAFAVLMPPLVVSAITISIAATAAVGILALTTSLAIAILGIVKRFQKVKQERVINPTYTVDWTKQNNAFINKSEAAKNTHINEQVSQPNAKEIDENNQPKLLKKAKKTKTVNFYDQVSIQGIAKKFDLNNDEDSTKVKGVIRRNQKDVEFREVVTDELHSKYENGVLANVSFEDLASEQIVTKNQFLMTFESTLAALYPADVAKGVKKHEIAFIGNVFNDVLLKSTKEDSFETIKNKFLIALVQKNGHKESIDRDTYEAMTHLFENINPQFIYNDNEEIESLCQNRGLSSYPVGKTAIFSRDFNHIDDSSEEYQENLQNDSSYKEYQRLNADFKDNTWHSSEERSIAYNVISRKDFDDRIDSLETIFNDPYFQLTFKRLVR